MNALSGVLGFVVGGLGAYFFPDTVTLEGLGVTILLSIASWYSGSKQIDKAQELKEAGWKYDPQVLRLAFLFGLILYIGGAIIANASIWWLLWSLIL